MTCEWCDRPARRSGLCWTHLKRKQRGKDMAAPVGEPVGAAPLHPREVLVRAALAFADADGEDRDEYRKAADRLRKAAFWYVRRTRGHVPEPVHTRGQSGQRGEEGTSSEG